jgi:hypothetical protein
MCLVVSWAVQVASPTYCDLASLRFLCSMSGGVMLLYRTLEDSTLPQDLYRRLRQLRGLGGVLRLRTSVEFQPVRAAGPCIADQQYDNLYHVLACDSYDTFAFDFEFTAAQGFSQVRGPFVHAAGPRAALCSGCEAPCATCRKISPLIPVVV